MPDQSINFATVVPTEQLNPKTSEIDLLSVPDVLTIINNEDQSVPLAVKTAIPQIAIVVEKALKAFDSGGHLYYFGSGTSGRLGVLDAAECPPTYGTDPALVQGIIAGGEIALRNAVEGAEDSVEAGRQAVINIGIKSNDVLIGISASGGAPFVVESVRTAKEFGAFTASLTCHKESDLAKTSDIAIVVEVGPEVVAGSTRMKAGTAQKLVLNMITTATMIAWGKTYRNLMVDLKPCNQKLKNRAIRLISLLSQKSNKEAIIAFEAAENQVKPAVIMLAKQVSYSEAQSILKYHNGKLRSAMEEIEKK